MPIHKVELTPDADGNAATVTLNTDLNMWNFFKFQDEGLIEERFVNEIFKAQANPEDLNYKIMMKAPWMAYYNANPKGMSEKEFFERFPHDMELAMTMYFEIVQGKSKKKGHSKETSNKQQNKRKKAKVRNFPN